jgi:hypothetical protein
MEASLDALPLVEGSVTISKSRDSLTGAHILLESSVAIPSVSTSCRHIQNLWMNNKNTTIREGDRVCIEMDYALDRLKILMLTL